MSDSQIMRGDAREILPGMPSESVHCCVTSPPYWGLRDYGTAKWQGGLPGCDHTSARRGYKDEKQSTSLGSARDPIRRECRKCGARRIDAQFGLESTPQEYVAHIIEVFREVRRVLRDDGTLFLILGDSYFSGAQHGSLKPKDLVGIPWRVAFALQADGWYLRSDIIWHKPNPMPESVTDRPTKAHEYIFLLAKTDRYYYDSEAVKQRSVSDHGSGNGFKRASRLTYLDADGPRGSDKPWRPTGKHAATSPQSAGRRMVENVARARAEGADHDFPFGATRNRRTVWTINTKPYKGAHFATFPPKLIEPCILAGCPRDGVVLDPFAGAGTTGLVAREHGRRFLGIELNPEYAAMARVRIGAAAPATSAA